MHWPLAIDRNRAALLAIAAAVFALIGGRDGAGPIARRLRTAALALLRPAESALRRLIVIAARGLAPIAGPARPAPALIAAAAAQDEAPRVPAFPLFDRPKRFAPPAPPPRGVPRIRLFWGAPAAPAAALPQRPDSEALVDAAGFRLRLLSFERALADLPRQARRLTRRLARQRAKDGWRQPLRPGRPPGHRSRPDREVDLVLRECHALALDALRPDTS